MNKCVTAFCIIVLVLIAIPAISQIDQHENNKHTTEFGLVCADCHTEDPPAKDVYSEKCMECHGSLQDIGMSFERTDVPNPHINHNYELYCEDCHHTHKPPDIYCIRCHNYDFIYDVP